MLPIGKVREFSNCKLRYLNLYDFPADQSQSKTDDQQYSVMAVTEGIKRLKQGVLALPAHKKPEILKRYIDFTKKVAEGSKNNPKLVSVLINPLLGQKG